LYRLSHPLAEAVLATAKNRSLAAAKIDFAYSDHEGKISLVEPLVGQSGHLRLSLLSVESLDNAEDHLLVAAATADGRELDDEVAARILTLPGRVSPDEYASSQTTTAALDAAIQQRQARIQSDISQRNARLLEAEADKLDGWAEDLKVGLEREIKELDRQIKEARRATTAALSLEEKLGGQKQIRALETQRNEKRRSLFDAQDKIDHQREALIAEIEGKLKQSTRLSEVFTIRWEIR